MNQYCVSLLLTLVLFPLHSIGDENPKTNYTAQDLILRLSELAQAEARQRLPQNFYGDYPNYPNDYYDYQNELQNPQNPYKRKRPIKQRPFPVPFNDYPSNYPGPYPNIGFDPAYPQQGFYPQGDPFANPLSGFTGALNSIARYDNQQCVPRLLCEVAAGGDPGGQQSYYYRPSNIPSFLNMDSLFTLLAAFTGDQVSPFLVFGRAALLGVTSRGNPSSCRYAYPECPRDPDKLVEYLNNHNGGFFRFFNGLQEQNQLNFPQEDPQNNQNIGNNPNPYAPNPYPNQPNPYPYRPNGQNQYPIRPQAQHQYAQQQYNQIPYPYYPVNSASNNRYPNRYQPRSNSTVVEAEARIQNKPSSFVNNGISPDLHIAQNYYNPQVQIKDDASWKFPEASNAILNPLYTNVIRDETLTKTGLKFPGVIQGFDGKRPKSVFFPIAENDDQNQNLYFPTPLPFYDYSKMIYPDRTGTGNLKFDSNKLYSDSQRPDVYYQYNDQSYYDNRYQPSKKYVYIVRGNGDPNNPEIVESLSRQLKSRELEEVSKEEESQRHGTPWTFPDPYQGVIYNDRSFDVNIKNKGI